MLLQGSLAAFGSPAEMSLTPEVGAAVPGQDMTSAEARAMNAQAGGFSAFAAAFPSLSQLRSPLREPSNRSSWRSAGTSDEVPPEEKNLQGALGVHSRNESARADVSVDLMPMQRSVAFGSTFGTFPAQFPAAVCEARAGVEDLIPAEYGPYAAAGPLVGGSPYCDSDSEQGDSAGYSDMSQDSECDDENPTGYSNFSIDLLAATLGNRFETLLLSPDNQVPLLHKSLGRKVSAHGGVAELHAEPWGRKAVFGSRSTGRASVGSQPGMHPLPYYPWGAFYCKGRVVSLPSPFTNMRDINPPDWCRVGKPAWPWNYRTEACT